MQTTHIIALEGIDGAGKSTMINQLVQRYPVSIYQRTKKGKLIDWLVRTRFFKRHIMLQIPIYLLLSYKNYVLYLIKTNKKPLVIMDRCFLSNICYFFPQAINDKKLFTFVMKFEIPLHPKKIFVLDVKPEVGRERDQNKKDLNWLIETRNTYNRTVDAPTLKKYNIQVIEEGLSIREKYNVISEYIEKILSSDGV